MIKKISDYLLKIGVEHATDIQRKALSFDVNTPDGTWPCSILVNRNDLSSKVVGVYSTLPVKVPVDLLNHMALFLMCLNNDRLYGNFELDPDTGDLHFKTYLDFENRAFSEKAVEHNMICNISVMQKYTNRFMRMINCA
jgi:hypothetical protein